MKRTLLYGLFCLLLLYVTAQNPVQQFWLLNDSYCKDFTVANEETYSNDAPVFTVRNLLGTGTYIIPSSQNFQVGCGNISGTIQALLDGTGWFQKIGTGTVILTNENTYSGNTIIADGILQVGDCATGSLGSGNYAGAIANNGELIINTPTDQTLSGVISGTGSLTKLCTATTTLTGNNTYTGTTTITEGLLQLGNGFTNSPMSGSAYDIAEGATLRWFRTSDTTFPTLSKISGSGTISFMTNRANDGAINSWGALSLPATFTGTIQSERGRIIAGATSNFGNATSVIVYPEGQIFISGGTNYSQDFYLSGNGYGETGYEAAMRLSGQTLSGNIFLNENTTIGTNGISIINGTISGDYDLSFGASGSQMQGTIVLSNSNSYTGKSTFNYGTVKLDNVNALSTQTILNFNQGTLQYSPNNNKDYSSQFSTSGNQNIKIDTNGQEIVYASQISGAGTSLSVYNLSSHIPADYLVVGGGAGGTKGVTNQYYGVGGGAGGALSGIANLSGTFTITIGNGGSGSTSMGATGNNTAGGASSIAGDTNFTANGGNVGNARNGGSSGNGNAGATGASASRGAGGGGAGGAGNAANGGNGIASTITGTSVIYGVGGGSYNGTPGISASASANTGGGGSGGSSSANGGAGGSGIVVIAYPDIYPDLYVGSGLTYTKNTTSRAGYKVYKFTSGSGTIKVVSLPLTLSASNSYDGGTIINSGACLVGNDTNAFGTGVININDGGILKLNKNIANTIILNSGGYLVRNGFTTGAVTNNGGTIIP